MPREGTKTECIKCKSCHSMIEIRYAPGGDENSCSDSSFSAATRIEIRYAPGGDENLTHSFISPFNIIEIRCAPGGDENFHSLLINLLISD